jgi:hypothetical protein
VSGNACRLAPVAIDELNLSELYVARPAFPPYWDLLPGPNLSRVTSWLRAREPTTDRTARSGCPWFRPFAEVISIFLYPDG